MFAIGLAGSVFFSLDFNSARWRVALYLVLTIAPFAVATPLIGPMIDRIKGGRRWIIVGSMAARAILSFFVVRHLSSLLFYPEAFMMLVLGKVYTISKSAIVPSTVRSGDELVEANSKLTVISAIAVVVAAGPAGLLLKVGGPGWSLGLAALVFAVATGFALQLPRVSVAEAPADQAEREELRGAGITLASSAMALVRGIVGFLAFMLAFDFKNGGAPLWYLGVVAATAQIGFFLGAIAAPRVRHVANEEQIIIGTLVTITIAGFLTSFMGGLQGAALLSAMVGATSSAARQAFDAIVQRDAPDANRGRTFARFEMRFQLIWVVGALLPIVIPIPSELGFSVIAIAALFALVSYSLGLRHLRQGRVPVRRKVLRRRRNDPVAPPGSAAPASPPAGEAGAPVAGTPNRSTTDATLVVDPTAAIVPTAIDPTAIDPTGAIGTTTVTRGSPTGSPGRPGGTRGWVRPRSPAWEPPPGFVSSRLGDEQRTVSTGEDPWPRVFDEDPLAEAITGAHVQIELPLDVAVFGDTTTGDTTTGDTTTGDLMTDGTNPDGSAPDGTTRGNTKPPVRGGPDDDVEQFAYPEPLWRDTPTTPEP